MLFKNQFILFLIVDTQYPFYPYAVAGTHDDPDKKGSATACIIASCVINKNI